MNQAVREPSSMSMDQVSQRVRAFSESATTWSWARRVVLALLLVWVCLSIAKLILLLLPQPALPAPPATALGGVAATSSTATRSVNIDTLLSLNLFGEAGATLPAPAPQQVLSLPEANAADTKLNLQLRGVLMSTDPNAARAIIASGNKQDLYAVGETIPVGRNVTLSKVLAERVILSNAGKPESLWLYDEKNKSSRSSSSSLPRARALPVQADDYRDEPEFASEPEQSQPADTESDDLTESVADATGVKTLADVVKLSVERRDGNVVGYKIRPGRDGDLFAELGLESGDIVTSINGIQLDSSSKVMQVYRELKDQTSATLTLLRGDDEMTMDITL